MKKSFWLLLTIFSFSFGLVGILFADEEDKPIFGNDIDVAPHRDDLPVGVVFQDEQAAWNADVAILAKETGLSVAVVNQAMLAQQAFTVYADDLLARYPNLIATVWMEPLPGTKGHIQFVGAIPADVAATLDRNGHNQVAIITGGGLISLDDQYIRADITASGLQHMGYANAITFFDQMGTVIQIELQISRNEEIPTVSQIIREVQNQLQGKNLLQGNAAVFSSTDFNLVTFTDSKSVIIDQHTYGGTWLRDDGVRKCTSGWSVSGPNGNGIITAGHCTGLNQFEQPGVAPYGMTYRSGVVGAAGDVEYHTTTHEEYDDFYSNATTLRDVTGIKSTSTMVGNSVCVYGRSSNVRTCNHVVKAVNLTIGSTGKLARATNVSTIGGDSGGGWSLNNTAWGVHKGIGSSNNVMYSYFTPAQAAQSALNVTIKR